MVVPRPEPCVIPNPFLPEVRPKALAARRPLLKDFDAYDAFEGDENGRGRDAQRWVQEREAQLIAEGKSGAQW